MSFSIQTTVNLLLPKLTTVIIIANILSAYYIVGTLVCAFHTSSLLFLKPFNFLSTMVIPFFAEEETKLLRD